MQASVRATAAALLVLAGCAAGGAPSSQRPEADTTVHGAASPGRMPGGPRHVVASGTFGDGWGNYSNEEWRYVVWGDAQESCARFEIGETETSGGDRRGVSCSEWDGKDPARYGDILARAYDPGDEKVRSLAHGQVSLAVETVEFRLTTGDVVRVDALDPPAGTDIPLRYYVALLPFSYNGEMLALDAGGDVLEKVDLCHQSC